MVLATVWSTMTWAQTEPTYATTFKYDKRVHDFGTILEKNGKVSHVFTFTNTSALPVVISDVNSWCGCTTAEFTKTPVLPGKKAEVKVTYNPFSRPGKFSKEIVLNLNGGRSYTRVWVKGNVVPYRHAVTEDYPYAFGSGLYMGYKVYAFPGLRAGESYQIEQRLSNETDKPMTITFERVPNNTVLKMPASIKLKPRERTTFKVSYRAPRTHTRARTITIKVRVNGKEAMPMRVDWYAPSR